MCLAARLSNGLLPELVAAAEVVYELVLRRKGFVIITVDAVMPRPGLGCDVAVQGGQPRELDGASAHECLVTFLGGMLLQGVVGSGMWPCRQHRCGVG